MFDWQAISQAVALILSMGAGGGLFKVIVSRSKVQAGAVAIIAETSARQIGQLQKDIDKLREDSETTKSRLHQTERAMYAHQRWDVMVIRKLESLGETNIGDPPDLWV